MSSALRDIQRDVYLCAIHLVSFKEKANVKTV